MGYGRITLNKVLGENPDLSVLELSIRTVEGHSLDNGCTFEADAGVCAVEALGFDPEARASDLDDGDRERLALELEARETFCPHKRQGDRTDLAPRSPVVEPNPYKPLGSPESIDPNHPSGDPS
jgi:hypothetical protein